MKFSVPAVLSLLASAAVARPRAMDDDEGDPLPQTSRVTAFVVDEKGNPSIECWEFSNMVESMAITRKNGHKTNAYSLNVAAGRELNGLDILTWPPYTPIWPDPDAIQSDGKVHTEWLDFSNTFNLFNIQGGLINFKFSIFAASVLDDWAENDYTYQLENGDDWFYFEDTYTYSDDYFKPNALEAPLEFGTVSGSETEVMRLRFKDRPKYKVLHKGGCGFTGISTPSESSIKRHGKSKHKGQQYEL